MNNKKLLYNYLPLISAICIVIGLLLGKFLYQAGAPSSILFSRSYDGKVDEVIEKIVENYVDPVNENEITEYAITNLLSHLDPHSSYIPTKDVTREKERMSGKFEGIGIEFRIIADTLMVINAIKGGPSKKAGVLAGDRIIGLNDEKISHLLPTPVEVCSLGLNPLKVQASRLLFGDGYVTNNFSAYGNFSSIKNHKLFKSPEGSQTIGIIPHKDKSIQLTNFANQIQKELTWMGIESSLKFLDPYTVNPNGRLNQFELGERYSSEDADCLLVELPAYSDNWSTWKNALGTMPSQMITTNKMKNSGVSFNTTLGIASCLGSMPIGLDGNLTGIQVWIGMDVYSEGKKHIAAASTVCDATGMLIGYPPAAACSGERLDDAAFENIMHIIMDGISHHYASENQKIPQQIGLIRDGQFFENPRILEKIEKEYGVTIVVVNVKKQGSPKLAVENGWKYISADCGTLICGSDGGYIQTTGNGSGNVPGTPILRDILLVRGEVSIPHLLEDLFWLSKIHGGSTRQPGLPIPQAYAHKLAERAGRGVHIPNTFNTDMSFL